MSSLYRVTIEDVDDRRVEMRVQTVHPDAGPPPLAPTFPMNLLVDLWRKLEQGYNPLWVSGLNMSQQEAMELARQTSWAGFWKRLCDMAQGYEIRVTLDEFEEAKAKRSFRGKPVALWGSSNGQPYVAIAEDEKAFTDAVAPLVAQYEQDHLENQESYQNWPSYPDAATNAEIAAYEAREPRVLLVLTLQQPGLLGFIRPGVRFETAAYF